MTLTFEFILFETHDVIHPHMSLSFLYNFQELEYPIKKKAKNQTIKKRKTTSALNLRKQPFHLHTPSSSSP